LVNIPPLAIPFTKRQSLISAQMLLNWNTIDTCFLSSDWHNHTSLAFLATCLFSLLLVILLEGLRRGQRRFDQYLRDKHQFRQAREYAVTAECMNEEKIGEEDALVRTVVAAGGSGGWMVAKAWDGWGMVVLEQCSRAALYTAQFAVSYCIMLMFMYSNGTCPPL
jgi:copper transporter 1